MSRTPALAADAVLEAVQAKDEAALAALAEKDAPDPWLVADELCRRSEHDAAEAFAKAAPRVDVEALPAYVVSRRGVVEDVARRERVATALEALARRQFEEALAALGPAEVPVPKDALGVRLAFGRGLARSRLGQPLDAHAAFLSAAEAAEALGWLALGVRAYEAAGAAAGRGSAFPAALAAQQRRLRLCERRSDRVGAARSRSSIGVIHQSRGEYAKANAILVRAHAEQQAVGDRPGAALTLENLGIVHFRLGNYEKAVSIYERVLAEQQVLGNPARVAGVTSNLGNVYVVRGSYEMALSNFEQALAEQEALGDRAEVATTLGNIGVVHQRLGAYAKALAFQERALAIQESLGDAVGAARTRGNMGIVHDLLGDPATALSYHERALETQEALGDRASAAKTLSNIGSVRWALGEYRRALSFYERALAAQASIGDRAGAARTLANAGVVHEQLGNYAKALEIYEQALQAKEALGDRDGVARTLLNLGSVHLAFGDYAKALSLYERSLAMRESLGDRPGVANSLMNIGALHHRLGDSPKALGVYERALALQEATGNRTAVALTLGNLALVHSDLGDQTEALSRFESVLTLQEALEDRAGATRTSINIGVAHFRLGQGREARAALERGVRAARRLRAVPLLVHGLRELARLHLHRGEASRALGRTREALRELEGLLGGLGEEEGASARAEHADLFAIGALAAVRERDAAEALTFLESARAGALLDTLGKREALRWKAESLPPELLQADRKAQTAQRRARHEHDRALASGNLKTIRATTKDLDDATEHVRDVAARIQRTLKAEAGLFYPRVEPIETIESALAADQALVLYGLCLNQAVALVLRQDGERIVDLGSRADVDAACDALDLADRTLDPSEALVDLRRLLVAPLDLGEDVTQVLVSPEGALGYLPFSALFEATVTMTPSGSTHVLLLDEERALGEGVLALGDPDYRGVSESARTIYHRGRTLAALPATRAEVEAVGTTRLLGAEANEQALRVALGERARWKAVHLACHGLIDVERPMLSSLALSTSAAEDGFLTALEVLRMEIPADLAVLSACETATGRVVSGEGIVGLTRVFMYAGAPRVMCSLWKVDDEATQALMIKFYELWRPKDGSKGVGAAAALQKAQAFVCGHEKWKHPHYWAAWVLWGLPD